MREAGKGEKERKKERKERRGKIWSQVPALAHSLVGKMSHVISIERNCCENSGVV